MSLRARVEAAIDRQPERDGVTVIASGGKVLADRPALEGGAHVVLVMPPEPPQGATRPEAPTDRVDPPPLR